MLVVRKYLYDICVKHGLIARHIAQHLDISTEMVFMPSREEIIALAVSHTKQSKERNKLKSELGGGRATAA